MADDVITENDDDKDDLEIIEVEEIPAEAPGAKPDDADDEDEADDKKADSEEDDGEDTRLADDKQDDEDDSKSRKRKWKRVPNAERRRVMREGKEAANRQIDHLTAELLETRRRLEALEGNSNSLTGARFEDQIAKADDDMRLAERIFAEAVKGQDANDIADALRIRDAAKDAKKALEDQKVEHETRAKPSQDNGTATRLAGEWTRANSSWYGVNPAATAIANRIDVRMANEGWDKNRPEYFQELTQRVTEAFQEARDGGETRKDLKADPPAKKRAPPQGGRGESGGDRKTGVYVTPERKEALIEKGVWDDPKERARYLRAFEKYDRENRSAGQ